MPTAVITLKAAHLHALRAAPGLGLEAPHAHQQQHLVFRNLALFA